MNPKMPTVMRKQFLLPLFLLITLAFVSCKKESDTSVFNISGINNLKINRAETQTCNVTISQIQGTPEQVTLSLKGVPDGVSAAIETQQGLPNPKFIVPLSFIVSRDSKMGDYEVTLSATSASCVKSLTFKLSINDQLSMIMTVYDGTQWTVDLPAGKSALGATVNLYVDSSAYLAKTPAYTASTDSIGKAYFYHVTARNYLFTVDKGDLSNIVVKKSIGGLMKGFVTTGIFQNKSDIYSSAQPQAQIGQLRYRDMDGDNKITDADRTMYDMVMVYEHIVAEKIIWIGK